MRTVPEDPNDIWPAIKVWIPTAVITYLTTGLTIEWILNRMGYRYMIPLKVCGGWECETTQAVASSQYGASIGLGLGLTVFCIWYFRAVWIMRKRKD